VDEVLEADHLCFFVHRVVERLDLGRFESRTARRAGYVPPFADAEGVALRVCDGSDVEPACGAAHPRGPGLSLSGGQRPAGLLGAERVPAAAWACDQRLLHFVALRDDEDPKRSSGRLS
jgi:hypothetical protein